MLELMTPDMTAAYRASTPRATRQRLLPSTATLGEPSRPRPLRRRHRWRPEAARRDRPLPSCVAARHDRRTRHRTPSVARRGGLQRRIQPRRHQERLRHRPRRHRVRTDVDAPTQRVGTVRTRRPDRPPRPRGEVRRWSGVRTAGQLVPHDERVPS
jgi:hypothetical protein